MLATIPTTRLSYAQAILAALAIALAATSAGCARPLSSGLADLKTDRLVEAAAADDSIPSADEVGLDERQRQATAAPIAPVAASDDDASDDATR